MEKDCITDRFDELKEAVDGNPSLIPLIKEAVYLENQLENLRELPKIRVNPKDPAKQKATPAAKLYKEYLQQYTNVIKILVKESAADAGDEDSPLRRWFREHADQ